MDILGALGAAVNYIIANWSVVEGLARGLAADLAALWVLAVGLAAVLKPFFPKAGAALQDKAFGVLGMGAED